MELKLSNLTRAPVALELGLGARAAGAPLKGVPLGTLDILVPSLDATGAANHRQLAAGVSASEYVAFEIPRAVESKEAVIAVNLLWWSNREVEFSLERALLPVAAPRTPTSAPTPTLLPSFTPPTPTPTRTPRPPPPSPLPSPTPRFTPQPPPPSPPGVSPPLLTPSLTYTPTSTPLARSDDGAVEVLSFRRFASTGAPRIPPHLFTITPSLPDHDFLQIDFRTTSIVRAPVALEFRVAARAAGAPLKGAPIRWMILDSSVDATGGFNHRDFDASRVTSWEHSAFEIPKSVETKEVVVTFDLLWWSTSALEIPLQ